MVWQYALNPKTNHWITEFVCNLKKPLYVSKLNLVEVNRYPSLDLVNIYKVYKDKRDRFHYFSLSQPETIELFLETKNLWKVKKFLECADRPSYRVRKIYLKTDFDIGNHEYLYCLPQVNLDKNSRPRA